MRIGFDAKRAFNNFTGLGNYARNLLTSLAEFRSENDYYLYTTKVQESEVTKEMFGASFSIKTPHHLFKAYWRSFEILNQLKHDQIELYHGLSNELPINIHKSGIKSIVTIHDLIFKDHPEWYAWADRKIYDVKFQYACHHADLIVAITESTKADVIKHYHIPEQKIKVAYQSCDEYFYQIADEETKSVVTNKYSLPEQYLLYVGSVIERKNLLGLVKAISMLPENIRSPLVVVGTGKKYMEKVKDWARSKKLDKNIIWIDSVINKDLPAIYQKAQLFVYPSYYEGFGIPVIEALFSRTPVITSNTSSLREAGGPSTIYVDPNQPEEIANAIEKIISDDELEKKMRQDGYAYAQKFHRKATTETMISLYQSVLKTS